MNYDSIKSRIIQFKSNDNLDENIYNKILNDLDKLYQIKSSAFIQITSNQYILNEKENFRVYLISKLLKKTINSIQINNYEIAYNYIKQVESLNPTGSDLETMDKLKKEIQFFIKIIEGNKLIEKKEFLKAIQYFKNLEQTSNDLQQIEIFNNGFKFAKAKYFKYLTEDIINLLPKKQEKNCSTKYQELIQKCELLFKEFQNERQNQDIRKTI